MEDAYRSYVIRVKRRLEHPEAVHLELEDLNGGRRTALSGVEARTLADRLVAMLREPGVAPGGDVGLPEPEGGG